MTSAPHALTTEMSRLNRLFAGILVITIALFLASCGKFQDAEEGFRATEAEADRSLQQIEPRPNLRRSLVVNRNPWFGGRAIPLAEGDPLPSEFLGQNGMVVTINQPLSLREAGRLISDATGLRVSVASSSGENDSGTDTSANRSFTPVGGREFPGGKIVWAGSLDNFLDQASDHFDADWTYVNNQIRIYSEVTRTFMLHALGSDVEVENELQSGATNDGLPQVEISAEDQLNIWDDIEETVNSILSGNGRATFASSTGTITVSGPISRVRQVEDYLRFQNRMRLRRVAVAVKVLSVDVSNRGDFSFDLNSVIEEAISDHPVQFNGLTSGLTAGILSEAAGVNGTVEGDISAVIEALEQNDRVSVSNSGAIVTLSDQPAPLQIGTQISFIERVSGTSDSGGATLEPGTIETGLTLNILPRVIEQDRVLMRLGVGITDASRDSFEVFETADFRIELPEINSTGFLQNAVLTSGETLVLAGFERRENTANRQGGPAGFLTGLSKNYGQNRSVTVLLISAEILPEEPISVIGRR